MSDFFARMNKGSKDPLIETMEDNKENYTPRHLADSKNIMLNVQMSSRVKGGFPSNRSVMLVGDSSSGKSLLSKIFMLSFQELNYDIVYIDTEGDVDYEDFKTFGIDASKVGLLKDCYHINEMKKKCSTILNKVTDKDRVFFVIDSIGNLPSKKEFEDRLTDSESKDMTRAQEIGSMYRCLLKVAFDKQVPLLFIAREYQNMNVTPYTSKEEKTTVGGGKAQKFSPSIILQLSTKDIKKEFDSFDDDGKPKKVKESVGVRFNVWTMKNRFAKRNTNIYFDISYKTGLQRYSGLFPHALRGGFIEKLEKGFIDENGEKLKSVKYRLKSGEMVDKLSSTVWEKVLESGFSEYLKQEFEYKSLFSMDDEFGEDVELEDPKEEVLEKPIKKDNDVDSIKEDKKEPKFKCLDCKIEIEPVNPEYTKTSKGDNCIKWVCTICGKRHYKIKKQKGELNA